MKKFLTAVLLAAILILLPVQVLAASSASVVGPEVVRAGDTITVYFRAGGGISGGSGSLSYDSSQLTLQGFSSDLKDPWAVEIAGNNFVFYDNSMTNPISTTTTIFKAVFRVSSSLQPGTQISVSATGVTLSDGVVDTSIGTRTYTATIAEPLSSNANLKSLTVSNAQISPAFSAGTTSYSASVPYTTDSLEISAEAEHPGARVSAGNTSLTPNAKTDVTVTVTAEDGTKKVYTIRTSRAKDPNYVESDVNTLASLGVEGFPISPEFSADRAEYAVYIPYETQSLKLTAETTDKKAEVAVPVLEALPVGQSVWEIPVTAENGSVRSYSLTVFRADIFDPNAQPPAEPATEPTEPPTEPTVAPTTEPTAAPTEAAPIVPEEPESADQKIPAWVWLLVVAAFFGGVLVMPLVNKLKKQ